MYLRELLVLFCVVMISSSYRLTDMTDMNLRERSKQDVLKFVPKEIFETAITKLHLIQNSLCGSVLIMKSLNDVKTTCTPTCSSENLKYVLERNSRVCVCRKNGLHISRVGAMWMYLRKQKPSSVFSGLVSTSKAISSDTTKHIILDATKQYIVYHFFDSNTGEAVDDLEDYYENEATLLKKMNGTTICCENILSYFSQAMPMNQLSLTLMYPEDTLIESEVLKKMEDGIGGFVVQS